MGTCSYANSGTPSDLDSLFAVRVCISSLQEATFYKSPDAQQDEQNPYQKDYDKKYYIYTYYIHPTNISRELILLRLRKTDQMGLLPASLKPTRGSDS